MLTKRWTALLVVLAIAIVGSAGYLGARRTGGQTDRSVQAPSTIPVDRGDVQQVVSAPGHLVGTRQVTLAVQTPGRLAEVNVHPGDHVNAGDLLARLDTADLDLVYQNAQVAVRIAQDRLAQVTNPATSLDIATARARLDAAQASYNKLAAGPSPADLAAAQAEVNSAQAAFDAAVAAAGTTGSQLQAASASMQKAQVTLQQAQAAYDRVAARPDIGALPQAQQLQAATIDYNQAKASYEALLATSNADAAASVELARSELQQAQTALTRLQNQVTEDDLTAARSVVTQAENDLDKLLAGPEANALDIAQNTVEQAEIAAKQAQLKLDQARIVAPFDGVVLEVRGNAGDIVSSGMPLVLLSDPAAVEAVGTVIEQDLLQVEVGQAVDLLFEARPETPVKGHVAQIVPMRDASNTSSAYPVYFALDEPPAGLLPGMTVDASIIAERTNVLRLPRALVRAGSDGKATVQVWLGDHAERRTVTIGLQGDVYVEVLDGLSEGDQVVGQ